MLLELRQLSPDLRTVVLTTNHSDEDIFDAIRAGVKAYILKSSSLEDVTEAIRKVYPGESVIPPHIAHQLAQRMSRQPLSTREMEILRMVARGMKNHEIAMQLSISSNIVRNHMVNLLEKLDVRDRTEATAIAVQQGLVYLDEDFGEYDKRWAARSHDVFFDGIIFPPRQVTPELEQPVPDLPEPFRNSVPSTVGRDDGDRGALPRSTDELELSADSFAGAAWRRSRSPRQYRF